MRYVHEEYSHFAHGYVSRKFRRSPRRTLRPVPGGRWMVRKIINDTRPDLCWRAWSNGKARPYSRNFATHKEAVAWAHGIALTYKVGDPDTRGAMRQELAEKRSNEREA